MKILEVDISVIIPAFNAEKSIFRCLDSLKNASWGELTYEVLLIDNNCTDDTMLVAEQFDVTVVKQEIQGRSQARNKGASLAKGKLLCFLDADVYVENDYFIEVEKILNRENVGGVQGRIIPSKVDGQHSINKFRYRSIENATNGTFCLLNLMVNESPMINSAACSYKREAFELVGGFDEALERHEDIDLSRRVAYSGYLLASAERAQAHVIYHGEGWFSYFQRSFTDGFTKIDYERKWATGVEFNGGKEDQAYMDSFSNSPMEVLKKVIPTKVLKVSVKKKIKKVGLALMINWAILDLARSLWRFIRFQDSHYLFDFINQIFRLTGRVVGPFLRKPLHKGKVNINLCSAEKRLKKITFGNGKICFLKPSLRFVLLLKNPYMIDIQGHTIFSDDQSYPYFSSYVTLSQLGLFSEFATDGEQDSTIYSILKYKGLLSEKS